MRIIANDIKKYEILQRKQSQNQVVPSPAPSSVSAPSSASVPSSVSASGPASTTSQSIMPMVPVTYNDNGTSTLEAFRNQDSSGMFDIILAEADKIFTPFHISKYI